MSLVTKEIQDAINSLALLENEFRKLADFEAEPLYADLVETFVEGGDRLWWWEAFKPKPISILSDCANGFEMLEAIVPNSDELIWFVAEEAELQNFPIYEGTTKAIAKVIGECYTFEYYLISKDKKWLLCENHHNSLIGVGKAIEKQMAKIAT